MNGEVLPRMSIDRPDSHVTYNMAKRIEGFALPYFCRDIQFLDQRSTRTNGAEYWLPPGSLSRVFQITTPKFSCVDKAIGGFGFIIQQRINRATPEVRISYVTEHAPREIRTQTGDIVCFVPRTEGLSLIEQCWPPFPADGELHADVFGQEIIGRTPILPVFWQAIEKFRS